MAEATKSKKPTIPANAKKPQDRATAKKDVHPEDVAIEWEGQEYTIEAGAFDDAEVLEYLVEAQSGQGQYFILALKAVLGPQQWAKYKAVTKAASENGRVSNESARSFFQHIMSEAKAGN